MEEKKMQLNTDELDKVTGGVGALETICTYFENAGLLQVIAKMERKEAVQFMLDYIDSHGGPAHCKMYANALYDII